MELICPQCAAPVAGDDISPSLQLAHCGSCDHMWEYIDPKTDGIIPPEPVEAEPATTSPAAGLGSSLFDGPLQPKPLVSEAEELDRLEEETLRATLDDASPPVAEPPEPDVSDMAVQELLEDDFFGDPASGKPVRYKPELGSAPKGIHVHRDRTNLLITHRWFQPVHLFLALWALIWDTAMFGVVGSALSEGNYETLLFTSLHVLAGIAVTYFTLTGFLNRTFITVNRDIFMVRHGPLPWWGNKLLATKDITQLYCTENVQKTKNGTRHSYDVWAKVGYDEIKVLTGFPNAEIAWYIEDSIEEFLAITDKPVALEHNKPRAQRGLPILDRT